MQKVIFIDNMNFRRVLCKLNNVVIISHRQILLILAKLGR